jgi:hypothetical protein
MAKQEYGNCDTCGKPLDDEDAQADFNRRADMMKAALEDADYDTSTMLLAMFAARHLFWSTAEERKKARRDLIREIDRETKDMVIRGCDA